MTVFLVIQAWASMRRHKRDAAAYLGIDSPAMRNKRSFANASEPRLRLRGFALRIDITIGLVGCDA